MGLLRAAPAATPGLCLWLWTLPNPSQTGARTRPPERTDILASVFGDHPRLRLWTWTTNLRPWTPTNLRPQTTRDLDLDPNLRLRPWTPPETWTWTPPNHPHQTLDHHPRPQTQDTHQPTSDPRPHQPTSRPQTTSNHPTTRPYPTSGRYPFETPIPRYADRYPGHRPGYPKVSVRPDTPPKVAAPSASEPPRSQELGAPREPPTCCLLCVLRVHRLPRGPHNSLPHTRARVPPVHVPHTRPESPSLRVRRRGRARAPRRHDAEGRPRASPPAPKPPADPPLRAPPSAPRSPVRARRVPFIFSRS